MVKVFDNDIVKAFTGGESVNAIYTNGVKVWPMELPYFYYSWTPYPGRGQFYAGDSYYSYQNYSTSNYFSWVGSGFLSGGYNSSGTIQNNIEYVETNAKVIGVSGFREFSRLTDISLPNCETICSDAFFRTSIATANLPKCKRIEEWVFGQCARLGTVSLPNCEFIGSYAFTSTAISSLVLPKCEYIDMFAFHWSPRLSFVSLPVCSYIGSSAFKAATNYPALLYVNAPKCKKIDTRAFEDCRNLQVVNIPECERIEYGAFYGCSNLKKLTLPVCSYLGSYAFENCSSLEEITLGWSSVARPGTGLFSNISTDYKIYVPASLVDAYKNNMYWGTTTRSRIFPIP